jgi:hypothetical protein
MNPSPIPGSHGAPRPLCSRRAGRAGFDRHAGRAGNAGSVGNEAGFVAGLEALVFGVLVFVFGTLILVNGWAVIDAKFATNAAAREAVRSVIQAAPGQPDEASLLALARGPAELAAAAHGFAPDEVVVERPEGVPGLDQCRGAPIRIAVEVRVPATLLPGFQTRGAYTVRSVHEEQIDPFRSGVSAC